MADAAAAPKSMRNILVTGILGITLVFLLAAACIFPFEPTFFMEWVGMAFMAATPAQIVLGLFWHSSKPDFINRYPLPLKGLLLTIMTVIAGAVVLGLIVLLLSGGHGITPMVAHFAIMTIVITMWMIPVWQCWPVTIFTKDPIKIGLLVLLAAYVIAYGLWVLFFNYAPLAQINHPHYYAELDPAGLFDMWTALVFFVTTAGVIIVHFMLDFWPIEKMVEKLSAKPSQPMRVLVATAYILILSYAIQYLFVNIIGLQRVEYMVRVPVCMIFGTFLVNNMMQFGLFPNFPQPKRGLILIVLAAIVAAVMFELYAYAATLHAGPSISMGPTGGFQKEIWIASAMLGVTFPIVFVVSGFFAFWPVTIFEKTEQNEEA